MNAQKEKVSILEDVDFELELIHRDEINVSYILRLLMKLKEAKKAEQEKHKKAIIDILSGEVRLRSKKELIEKFIEKNLPKIADAEAIPEAFENFWNEEKKAALEKLCKEEKIAPEKMQALIDDYLFTEREPLRDDIVNILEEKPKILERKTIVERIIAKMKAFVEMFISGTGIWLFEGVGYSAGKSLAD